MSYIEARALTFAPLAPAPALGESGDIGVHCPDPRVGVDVGLWARGI